MGRIIPAFSQFLDGNGDPVVNGWLQFLVSNTNNTPKDTYADPVYQIPNANPLQLDAEGRCPNVYGVGDYRVVSFLNDPEDEDSPGEQIQMFDPVTAQGTLETTGGSGTVFDEWVITTTYDLGDIVQWNLSYYRSLINSNLGFDPLSSEFAWERVDFIVWYNSQIFYESGDLVYYEDNLYLSLTDSNQGNTPSVSPTNWRRVSTGYTGVVNSAISYVITANDRDKLVILNPSATSDETFTLPAMDSTTDRFKVSIYNASDYTVTLDASGSAYIWLNTSGQLDISNGCLIELMYNSFLDTWLPIGGNVGPVLGGQDIGSSAIPANDIFCLTISATTLSSPTITATQIDTSILNVPSDGFIYLGDSDEVILSYTSLSTSLDISVAAGVTTNYIVDSIVNWTFAPTGEIIPGASNPKPELGSATNSLDFIYSDNVSLPTGGYLFLGDADQLVMGYTGTSSDLLTSAELHIGTTTSEYVTLYSNNIASFKVVPDGTTECLYDLYVKGTTPGIHWGDPFNLLIYVDGSGNGIYQKSSSGGESLFRHGGSTIFKYNASYVTFFKSTTIADDVYLYIGYPTKGVINYDTTYNTLGIYSDNTIWIQPGTSLSWIFQAAGHFVPNGNAVFDIGDITNYVRNIYSETVYSGSSVSAGFFGIGAGTEFGISTTNKLEVTSMYEGFDGLTLYYFIEVTNNTTGNSFKFRAEQI